MAISAEKVRYIKLGRGGSWDAALDRGEIPFGYGRATHELALAGDFDALKQYLIDLGKDAQVASMDSV